MAGADIVLVEVGLPVPDAFRQRRVRVPDSVDDEGVTVPEGTESIDQ